MAQSDRSNSVWSNDIIITWHSWLVLSWISSQWARCSTFKYMTSAHCSSLQSASETLHLPSSTCIDLLRGDSCMLYGGYFLYVIWAAAFCVCIGSSKSRYLLCRSSSVSKTKYINIVMYITMPIPPRVVMTEIILMTFCSISSCQTSAFIRQFGRNIILKESKWIIK